MLAESLETSIAETDAFITDEINRIEGVIADKESAAEIKHNEIAQNVRANSDILASLTNGEQTGVVDKLDRQFHEITRGLDETSFEGLLKSMMDRITQLESTIAILVSGVDVQGSVASVVNNALNESKEYTDVKSVAALENAVTYANDTFQVKGNYIESIPSEYVTEEELINRGYATVEFVNAQNKEFLSKDMADLLYAEKNDYVTTIELDSRKYVNISEVENATNDMATKTWVDANYQEKGNYISEVPSEFVTESELSLFLAPYAKEAWVHSLLDGVKNNIVRLETSKLDKTMADSLYQPKGSYVTSLELAEKMYISRDELMLALSGKADISYVNNEINRLNLNGYVTKSELESKDYIDSSVLESKGYVTLTYLSGAIADMQTKSDAVATYVTKVAFDEYKKVAFNANNIIAGDNIKISSEGANIRLAIKLSDSYNVVDSFEQNLPAKGDNLDIISMKLSEAIKKLYDTTDGEMF